MADTKDPFAEFGGSAVETPAPAPVDSDPFAEFGGAVSPPVETAPVPAPATTPEEPSFLEQAWEGVKGIPEAAQTLAEGVMSPLGLRAPVAAAEALPNYIADAVTPGKTADFGKSYDQAVQGIEQRAEKFKPTAAVGRLAGDIGATIATGGLGYEAASAKVLSTQAAQKLSGTAAKLLGQKVAPIVGGALALGAEGALQGAEQAAATAIDKTIQSGDWQSLGEKLIATVPAGALEGAKWNMVTGAAMKGLGLLGRGTSKADDALALQVDNAAAPTTQTENIYDASKPLRSSEIIDRGTEEAVAARKLTTPEVAKELHNEVVPQLERDGNRLAEIDSRLDHELKKATKTKYLKEFQQPWTGPSFQETMAANGITKESLEDLASRSQGEGAGLVRSVARKYDQAVADLGDKPPTLGEMYYQLDLVKSSVQKAAAVARKKGNSYVHDSLYEPSEALRAHLEDPLKIGSPTLAEGQKKVNFEWARDINASRQAEGLGLTQEGRMGAEAVGGDNFDVIDVYRPDAIKGLVTEIGVPGGTGELREESLRAALRQRNLSYGERLRWSGEKDPELRKLLAERYQLVDNIENNLNRVGLANRYAAENAAKATGDGLAPLVAGGLVGATTATVLGPVGGTVAAGAGAFAGKKTAEALKAWRTGQNAQRSGAALGLKRAAVKTQERLNKAIKRARFFDAVEDAADIVRPVLNIEEIQRDTTKAIEQIDKRRDEKSEEYKKTLSRIDEIRDHAGEELAQAYASQLDRRDSFLADKAGPAPRTTVFGTEKRELDEETAATLHRAMAAADDPIGAIERLSNGTNSVEDVEALEALFPSLLAEWKTKVVDELASSKKKPTAEQAEILSSILGVGFLPDSDAASIGFYQGLASTGADESNSGKANSRMYKGQADATKSRADRLG
jgi:hypothetical protein